ncbi:MAG: DUF3160 domain-containing protein, partial [Hymenobacteraceae bacterium]|nr:DUF3160 domain-containing protein [Hymenobacteraceae bacterium]
MLLRNEVYARNGYCFDNATLRHYFDKLPYYRPIWEVEGFRVPLNRQELAFVARVHARELALLPTRVAPQNGYPLLNVDFASNLRELLVSPTMRAALTRQNFVIVPTPEEQLFYLYDQNQYDYTPTFVTTDLFLQLLHKYLNGILSDVEEKRLVPLLTELLAGSHRQAEVLAARCQQPEARRAAEWAAAYYAVANELLTGRRRPVSEPYRALVAQEVALATAAQAKASVLLGDSLFQYNALKPRGMYTRTDTTRRFFRAMKWLNTAPVFLDSDAGLLHALALAQALDASPTAARHFDKLTQVINLLAGDEDNRSLTNLRRLLQTSY